MELEMREIIRQRDAAQVRLNEVTERMKEAEQQAEQRKKELEQQAKELVRLMKVVHKCYLILAYLTTCWSRPRR